MSFPEWARFVRLASLVVDLATGVGLLTLQNGLGMMFTHLSKWPLRPSDVGWIGVGLILTLCLLAGTLRRL